MKKRILQLVGSFHLGGSERQAVALTRSLKEEGSFDVFAATLNKKGVLKPAIDALGLSEIHEFPLTSFFNLNFVKQARRFSRYLKENEIDLIQTHDFYTNVFGMAATIAGVTARVASKRETGEMRSEGQNLVEKAAFGRAHAIVVNSQAVKRFLVGNSVSAEKIHTIYNGIDIDDYDAGLPISAAARETLGLPSGENIRFVTLVANLRHDVKNVPMLLRAAKNVAENTANVHFVIAGEGELETPLRAMANDLCIADIVHFVGRCEDVPALLSTSDIGVLTSKAEGFSTSILEYMAAGKPVIATNVGGAAEAVVEGETGYLVRSDDDKMLAERICDLVMDDAKAAAFGKKGKDIVRKKFSREAQLRSTIELYNSILG